MGLLYSRTSSGGRAPLPLLGSKSPVDLSPLKAYPYPCDHGDGPVAFGFTKAARSQRAVRVPAMWGSSDQVQIAAPRDL